MVKGTYLSVELPHDKLEQILRDVIVENHPNEAEKNFVMEFTNRYVNGYRKLDVKLLMLDDDQYADYLETQRKAAASSNRGKSKRPRKEEIVSEGVEDAFED